jgi:hypothetical protein
MNKKRKEEEPSTNETEKDFFKKHKNNVNKVDIQNTNLEEAKIAKKVESLKYSKESEDDFKKSLIVKGCDNPSCFSVLLSNIHVHYHL